MFFLAPIRMVIFCDGLGLFLTTFPCVLVKLAVRVPSAIIMAMENPNHGVLTMVGMDCCVRENSPMSSLPYHQIYGISLVTLPVESLDGKNDSCGGFS